MMNISNLFRISVIFLAGFVALLLVLAFIAWGGKGLYLVIVAVMVIGIVYRARKAWKAGRHEAS